MSDPPAPDLGAIRQRLEAIGVTGDWWLHDMELTRSDIATFLTAFDAQAAQLAALEAENGALRARLREAEGRAWYEVDDGA